MLFPLSVQFLILLGVPIGVEPEVWEVVVAVVQEGMGRVEGR